MYICIYAAPSVHDYMACLIEHTFEFSLKCVEIWFSLVPLDSAVTKQERNPKHNINLAIERLRLIKDALLSPSRERKRAGSPDDPQRGWLLQGTNA